jgi:hypothetical protein
MALTPFQRYVCRLLAENRIRIGESYVAGGDTEEALSVSWRMDRDSLERDGLAVSVIRERPSFIEAGIARGGDSVVVQWAQDSAYRFFPLVGHQELGLVLHPFDLATNKVLALVGRVEPRDFVDALTCDRELQPLGYLAWAACGKDPGFSPAAILEQAARSSRYAEAELAGLDFEGVAPSAAELSRQWHLALAAAREVVALLPPAEAGRAVLTASGELFRGEPGSLRSAMARADLMYHEGSIRGAFPRMLR